ncbi:MAG TPA: amidohydrolase family protein [Thermomicrobiales bacterium]|nr:amidohydrolase family protein [Thermomicrobiales bacterium]
MPIVDAHVHIFPDEIVEHRERFLERDDWFRQLYEAPRARLATAHDLIESMNLCGVEVSIACGFPWRDQGLCQYHNDYMFEAARSYPSRIAWLAIVSPPFGESAQALDQAFETGASGVGELNADAQGFDIARPAELEALVEVCIARDKAAMFHISEPVGHAYPGKGLSTPDKLLRFLAAYPDLRVVAAHWGGGLPMYELMPEVRTAAVNLVYDSAASTYLYDHKIFESTVELVGEDKVLFASDYPVLRQGPLLDVVKMRPWSSKQAMTKVLGDNAVKVYGLERMIE